MRFPGTRRCGGCFLLAIDRQRRTFTRIAAVLHHSAGPEATCHPASDAASGSEGSVQRWLALHRLMARMPCNSLLMSVTAWAMRSPFSCTTLTRTVLLPLRSCRATPPPKAWAGSGPPRALIALVEKAQIEVPPVVNEGDEIGHEAAGRKLAGGEAVPSPLVLEFFKTVFHIRTVPIVLGHGLGGKARASREVTSTAILRSTAWLVHPNWHRLRAAATLGGHCSGATARRFHRDAGRIFKHKNTAPHAGPAREPDRAFQRPPNHRRNPATPCPGASCARSDL